MKRWLMVLGFLAAVCLLFIIIILRGEVYTVLNWSDDSLREVYDPGRAYYTYAPAVISDGTKERIYTCHNSEEHIIRDDIYYTERVNGKIVVSKSVMSAGLEGAWDSFHVCDPSIVESTFKYAGENYKYAMFYLGNNVNASANNQIGVAFSNDLAGDWLKYPDPIVPHPNNGSWGVGQPSAINIDGKGKLLLFYTKGDRITGGYIRELDLSDMDQPVIGSEVQLTNKGLTKIDGSQDYLNNFDVVYNPRNARFYAIREQHDYPTSNPSYIGESQQLVSISALEILESNASWIVEAVITPQNTEISRNHNAGIARTLLGTLPDSDKLKVVFADSCAGSECAGTGPLWTYSLWEIEGNMIRSRR